MHSDGLMLHFCARIFFQLFSSMNNQKLGSDDAYQRGARPGGSRAFDALSRILVVLMGAALLLFGLLLVPTEFDALIDEFLGWCVAGVAAVVAFILAVSLIERRTD
jgi:hypothetical protein